MTVWHVAREYRGISEAGGIKDVVRSLAERAAAEGFRVRTVVPIYSGNHVALKKEAGGLVARLNLPLCASSAPYASTVETVDVFRLRLDGVDVYLIDSARFREKKSVYTYTLSDLPDEGNGAPGSGHDDVHWMNLLLQKAALELTVYLGERPDLFHIHDGHGGFLPAIARETPRFRSFFEKTAFLLTIHNAGPGYHQTIHDAHLAARLSGLDPKTIRKGLMAGGVDPLFLAAHYAAVSTVSEEYARQLTDPLFNSSCEGLAGAFLQLGIAVKGIMNGVDAEDWDPRDPGASGLPIAYSPMEGAAEGKDRCRRELLKRLEAGSVRDRAGLRINGLMSENGPSILFAFQGRITEQKGVSILVPAIRRFCSEHPSANVGFLVMGQGEARFETALADLCKLPECRGRILFIQGYEAGLAKLLIAASSFFLMPSLYEPCGLMDLQARMLGTIPLVRRTGGLMKSADPAIGYSFDGYRDEDLLRAMTEAWQDAVKFPQKLIDKQRRGMSDLLSRYSWKRIFSDEYLPFYRELIAGKYGRNPRENDGADRDQPENIPGNP